MDKTTDSEYDTIVRLVRRGADSAGSAAAFLRAKEQSEPADAAIGTEHLLNRTWGAFIANPPDPPG